MNPNKELLYIGMHRDEMNAMIKQFCMGSTIPSEIAVPGGTFLGKG